MTFGAVVASCSHTKASLLTSFWSHDCGFQVGTHREPLHQVHFPPSAIKLLTVVQHVKFNLSVLCVHSSKAVSLTHPLVT